MPRNKQIYSFGGSINMRDILTKSVGGSTKNSDIEGGVKTNEQGVFPQGEK
jgi:hypothetical protein